MQKKSLQSVEDLEGGIFSSIKEGEQIYLHLMLVALLFADLLFYEFSIYDLVIFQYCWPEVNMPAFVENQGSGTCASTDHLGKTRSH